VILIIIVSEVDISMQKLKLLGGELELPAFLPDATYGTVRALDFNDVNMSGISGVVMNTMHLATKPGVKTIKKFGGVKNFTGFNVPILTDSGGFQVFSLIRENADYGEIRNNEIIFRPDRGEKKVIYTPEKCISSQFAYKSDILMLVVSAMKEIGEHLVTDNDLRIIQKTLLRETKENILNDINLAPVWIRKKIQQII